MTSTTRFLLILWLPALLGAFLLGRSTQPNEPHRQQAAPSPASRSLQNISPTQALLLPTLLGKEAAFAHALQQLNSSAECEALFLELLPALDDPATHDALFLLADSWAALSPEEAVEKLHALEFNDPRNPFLFSALSQWANQNPQAALNWLNANHPDSNPTRDYLLAALIRGTAHTDSDLALQLLLDAPHSPERLGAVSFLVNAPHPQDRANSPLYGIYEKIPASEPLLRKRALAEFIAQASPQTLDTVSMVVAKVGRPPSAIPAIAARLSRTDPAAAATWAGTLPDPATRSLAYSEIATRWARIDPPAASAWLAQKSGKPEFDLAARAVAWSTVSLDPNQAFAQVASITNPALRNESSEQLTRKWMSDQPQNAKRYLQSDTLLPPALRTNLLDSFE